jgi:16S rRNA (cytosine967-C5)-methyltransferase
LGSVSTAILDLLRLGAYQILYMDGVPSYAAISQTVEQVKRLAGGGGGRMANGVLRSLEREGGAIARFPSYQEEPEEHLSTWGSHPSWMIKRWLERWGPEEVLKLVDFNNSPPPLSFRPLGISVDKALSLFSEAGRKARQAGPGIPCLILDDGTDPARILEQVPGIIQDPGAALVTVFANASPGEIWGDLCAAPGGKALALAGEGAYVLAADRSLTRLRLLKQGHERVGGRVGLVVALAQSPPFRELPRVLLDVPCTGTGTLRRHPDARWRLTLDTMERLARLQGTILQAGARLVPKGGVLVYSTCTLEPEENRDQIEAFLRGNPGFSLAGGGEVGQEFLDEKGYLSVLPQATGFDGAFGARLVRDT